MIRAPRMNRQRWLLTTAAALHWHAPRRLVHQAWNKLTPTEQLRLKQQIAGAIGYVRQVAARERWLYEQGSSG